MVIIQIYDDPGVLPVFRSQPGFAVFCYRMMVRIIIYSPVKFNAFSDLFRKKILLIPFYIISNEITDHQLIVITGKEYVCKEIQNIAINGDNGKIKVK